MGGIITAVRRPIIPITTIISVSVKPVFFWFMVFIPEYSSSSRAGESFLRKLFANMIKTADLFGGHFLFILKFENRSLGLMLNRLGGSRMCSLHVIPIAKRGDFAGWNIERGPLSNYSRNAGAILRR